MAKIKLRPCPFCGEATRHNAIAAQLDGDEVSVYCVECNSTGPAVHGKTQARKAWNDRKESPND